MMNQFGSHFKCTECGHVSISTPSGCPECELCRAAENMAKLAASQEPLGPEFEKVLMDNLDTLYVRD